MLSKIKTPSTKIELIKSIQSLKQPEIEVMEVLDRGDKSKLTQLFDRKVSRGNFSIIFIRDKG